MYVSEVSVCRYAHMSADASWESWSPWSWSYRVLWWLILGTLTPSEILKPKHLGMSLRDFLDWITWGGKSHSKSGPGSSSMKATEEGSFYFLPAWPNYCWKVHLCRCSPIPTLGLEPNFSRFQLSRNPLGFQLQTGTAENPITRTEQLKDSWSFHWEMAIVGLHRPYLECHCITPKHTHSPPPLPWLPLLTPPPSHHHRRRHRCSRHHHFCSSIEA